MTTTEDQYQCELYTSPMIDAIRTKNQVALEQVLHHLVEHCVQYGLPVASTVNQVIEANREFCYHYMPDGAMWFDQALYSLLASVPVISQPIPLRMIPYRRSA